MLEDKQHLVDIVTTPIAVGGATSPLWYHYLEQAGVYAQVVLPIVSVIWIAVQIYYRLKHKD